MINNQGQKRPKVLLGVTGSVAAVKCPELAVRLARDCGMDVKVLLTTGGYNFWQKASEYDRDHWVQVQQCPVPSSEQQEVTADDKRADEGTIEIHYAEEEWEHWHRLGDPVLHIDLRDWADLLVIAPLSAHTLAKIAHGLCDDTLSCVVRAWDFGHGRRAGKPLVLAPAMNTAMWDHPLTQQQLTTIQGFWNQQRGLVHDPNSSVTPTPTTINMEINCGVRIVTPQVKTLACGEVGQGALASVQDIIQAVHSALT